MRILLVTQYFYPENFKSNDIAFELIKRGYEVDALVGIPNYPEGKYFKSYGIFHKRIESINGVKVYRAFQTPRGRNGNSLGLSINYLTFAFFASFWAIYLSLFKKYNCIIVQQLSPITQALPAIIVKHFCKIPMYTWVLDIWPDSIILGAGIKNKMILSSIDKVVKFVYNQSDKILISSKQFADLIISKGPYDKKIIYFPNWSEDLIQMPIKKIPKLPDGFLIMMAGNIGTAQTMDAVMNAALIMKDIKYVKWIFIGDGSKKRWVDEFVKDNSLTDTVFSMGKFPFDLMPAFYKAANAMLLSLKADYPHIKAVVPARLQSYMAASRPVLAMVDGGSAEIINETQCGFVVGAGDYNGLVDAIQKKVLVDLENFKKKGINGRKYYEQNFSKDICINNLVKIINGRV